MKYTNLTDKIFTIEDFLLPSECHTYITLSENLGYEPAKVTTEKGESVLEEVRNNNRTFYKSEDLAEILWHKVQSFAPAKIGNSYAIGLNELFRFYKYQPGHRFKRHQDQSYIRNATEASYFTFMIYLNDNFSGGDTLFTNLKVQPKEGMALIFLHSLYHEGSEVTQGMKYVLRSDIMYRFEED
ncbi:2OG-Fe(II) oxygenase [Cytophagaceae bacterium DM2B3-1]|uniref:2OG-Fe(II) oxygenase n=1 Tax=Xanthocytophaga flava TaxID=3048013 RepID=A0ABT7CFT6_9BACT|nr:2OG-Fe(II) oxygenase [Xanthocytophaga flavus]MDJ1492602.1 2OG-Fe(II) oxygenase [Xanthocytophaga flavus]